MRIGTPRLHYRSIGSTNLRARELADRGAPHGTLVTASQQTAGRGRQGRSWVTPANTAIAASLILRRFDDLLEALTTRLEQPPPAILDELRAKDALRGQRVRWAGGEGTGAGIDDTGALLVDTNDGRRSLSAGEVHLVS